MKKDKNLSKVPLAIRAEEALKEAVAEAIADHKRAGHPIVIWRHGKVVHVPPDQIVIRETKAEYVTEAQPMESPRPDSSGLQVSACRRRKGRGGRKMRPPQTTWK
jgi:hypothetical protein